MLKITQSGQSLLLEGQVSGPWVTEVRKAVESQRSANDDLSLDLSGVTFVNGEGAELLRGLSAAGVRMRGSSRFVDEVLGGPKS